ncbi:zinc-dependent alcohol dehydrogenase family protein [Stratiformator vulcanicus]|uniref:Alcohol dehydrogenase n=1 Tax=Stratiformator vulcanicus TaxID=2527980 RepID=A0A517QVJ0_9PLAN|nr:NAD(P)-dependent alcohol dehydrogenase [Stratiformator vulcanicus]QDT35655.1 Alcohol dehydrogenase [Stratiformator vulcanicus]
MKAYQIHSDGGIDAIERVNLDGPKPKADEVLVRIRACSLNYRDLIVAQGGYSRNDTRPVIPLSDGAGEVVEVGEDVTEFKTGDRVAGCFFRDWVGGDPTEEQFQTALGGGIDGVLREYMTFKPHALVPVPQHLSFEEASTLPCAALTAWQALVVKGDIKAGHDILTLGTGGVSTFAIKFAAMHGARVIATSSSDEKLEQAKQLGATDIVNYRDNPEWHRNVRDLTDGRGVDNVVEVGGIGTLERSLKSAALNGHVSLIGVLSGTEGAVNPLLALFNRVTIHGIYVGSREMFHAMNRAIETSQLKPAIDRVFGFDEAPDAYRHLQSGSHVGKVVIAID